MRPAILLCSALLPAMALAPAPAGAGPCAGAKGAAATAPALLPPPAHLPREANPGRALAPALDAEVVALWHGLCPGARALVPLAPVNTLTAGGAAIWLLPCTDSAGRETAFAAFFRQNGQVGALLDRFELARGLPPRPLLLRFPSLGPWEEGAEAASGPDRPLALSACFGPDCAGLRVWLWTGRGFQLVRETPGGTAVAPGPELPLSPLEKAKP